jgi:hypothetical protein
MRRATNVSPYKTTDNAEKTEASVHVEKYIPQRLNKIHL